MLSLTKLIFGSDDEVPDARQELIQNAIEKALDASDPRLRALPGYQKRLHADTEVAVDFVLKAVDDMCPPLPVSPTAFGTDPQVRAFFGSADQIKRVFGDSREVREFLARPENAGLTQFCAVMTMQISEKRVLASELQGDAVRQDVMKTTLSFGDHAILLPSSDEAALRRSIKERVFVGLIEEALHCMAAEESASHELKAQRALLRSRLNALRARGLGLASFTPGAEASGQSVEEIERELKNTETKLSSLTPAGNSLEDHLEQLKGVLAHPEEYARFAQESPRVTRLGYEVEANSTDQGDAIDYTRITLRHRDFAALLVSYRCDELRPRRGLFDSG